MTKHTPRPWRFLTNVGYVMGSDGTGPFGPREVQVGTVGDYRDKELLPFNKDRWDADGRLVAAAPDLLAACQAALATHTLVNSGPGIPKLVDMLRAAIAKATQSATSEE